MPKQRLLLPFFGLLLFGLGALASPAAADVVPEVVIAEPVSVAQYADAVVIRLHGFDILRRHLPNLRLECHFVRADGSTTPKQVIDLTEPWEKPAVILEKSGEAYAKVLVALRSGAEVFLRRLYDLGPELEVPSLVPLLGQNAAIEPGQSMGEAPVIPLPDLTLLDEIGVTAAPREVDLDAVTRQARSDINYPLVSAKNNCAVSRQTAFPSDDSKRSIYVPLKSQLYDQVTGNPTIVAHYLCEVPLDPDWLNGTEDLIVNLGPEDVKVHNSDQTYNGYNILGQGAGGLGQLTGSLAVDADGNIYFAAVPSEVVRFNIAAGDWQAPPASIYAFMQPYRPTEDDIYGNGGGNTVGRWPSYRMVSHMNLSDPKRMFYAPVHTRLLSGTTYEWAALFSFPQEHWDDSTAFTDAMRFLVGSWPSCPYTFYDTLPEPDDTNRRLVSFTAYGNTVYIRSYPGCVGGPWRVDIAADGSVELFGTEATLPNFGDAYSKPRESKPYTASGCIGWWDYGLLTMTRDGLHYALTGQHNYALTGAIEIRYDAIAHMLLDPVRYASILDNIGGPSLAPAYTATWLPGQDGQVLGVAEYGYYLARFDTHTADPGYIDKTYLLQDTGDPDLELPTAIGLGPYAHVWDVQGDDVWLYVGGYTGLTRMHYSTGGTPLGFYTMDKFDTHLSTLLLDASGPGSIKRYRYLQPGLDDRIFLSGTHTADRNGTAYSGGLMAFHKTQLDTLEKLSYMSRCYHTKDLRNRIVRSQDGAPRQDFALRGASFDDAYAFELPPEIVPENHDPKAFFFDCEPGGHPRDLYGFGLAPEGGGVVSDGHAFSADRRYLVVRQANHLLTFDMQQRRFIDGKTLTYGAGTYLASFSRPDISLVRAPDDRLLCYATPSTSETYASFVEIHVSPRGELSLAPCVKTYAASATTMNQTYSTAHTFLPDLGNDDGSYDLFLGMPMSTPGTNCRLIEDFVPPRRFELSRTLNVLSSPTGGVAIAGDRPGETPYAATCVDAGTVSLTAPATSGGLDFLCWEDDDGNSLGTETTIALVMDADRSVFAVYGEVFALPLNVGWNLVSIPVEPRRPERDNVFPPDDCAAVRAYDPDSGYYEPVTIATRKGYWVLAGQPTTLTIAGLRPAGTAVTVREGWNLVGVVGPDKDHPWQELPLPAACVAVWGYLPPYRVPDDQCGEGRGFWIRATAEATIWQQP